MTEAELGSDARRKRMRTQKEIEVVEPNDPVVVHGHKKDHIGKNEVSADHIFDLDYTDTRGYKWTGKFKCHILNIKERAAVGLTRSRLTANTPAHVVDASTLNLLEMQAHLAVALDHAPEWASDLGSLYDVGVVAKIYGEVASHEARFWGADDGETQSATGGGQ